MDSGKICKMLLHAPSKVPLLFGCMFVSHTPMSSTKLFLLVAVKLGATKSRGMVIRPWILTVKITVL